MKLRIDQYFEDCGGSVCDLVDENDFVIAKCGEYKSAQEIVRRVNAHEALVTALKKLAEVVKGSNLEGLWINHPETPEQDPLDFIRAALALAEKGTTQQ